MKKEILLVASCCCSIMCTAQNLIDNYLTSTPVYSVIGTSANGVSQPRDLDFKPNSDELWVANNGTTAGGSVVIFYDAGKTGQTTQLRKDSHSGHFMIYPSAIAFGDDGRWACVSEIKSTASATSTFMGPALWSADTSIFARVFQNNWVSGKPLGSHVDMLHQSPFGMGIAHDTAGAYWVFDGHNGNICKYEFVSDHGPGYDDHSQGKIWRYTDVPVLRTPNIPSHMVKDKGTGWLYFVDAGNKNVKRLNTATGSITGTLTVPTTASEPLLSYSKVTGATVEIIASFPTSQPCGIDLYNGRMIVSDNANGDIYVYDISTPMPSLLGTINTGLVGIMGVKIGSDGKIWCVNNTDNKVYRIEPATLVANDASVVNITSPVVEDFLSNFYNPAFAVCNNSISPVITLANSGSNVLSSATIKYVLDNGTVNSYSWSGTLAVGATTSVTLPTIAVNSGSHSLAAYVINPNGLTDNNPANDKKVGSFRAYESAISLPLTEGFSGSAFPPPNWAYIGYNKNNPMSRNTGTGGFGSSTACLKMDNFSGAEDISGQIDYLISPRINMTSAATGTALKFSVAYAQYNAGSTDQLQVKVSIDCGGSWTSVYDKSGSVLATTSPTTSAFIPASSEWRKDSISLNSYVGQPDVQVMFVTNSKFGNNIYIDDIDIATPTGVNDVFGNNNLSIYPNPTKGVISIELPDSKNYIISVYDMVGKLVKTIDKPYGQNSRLNIDLSDEPTGIYIIKADSGNEVYYNKVSVIK
jgi:hypothetical protein